MVGRSSGGGGKVRLEERSGSGEPVGCEQLGNLCICVTIMVS